jgi:hypothetical protein
MAFACPGKLAKVKRASGPDREYNASQLAHHEALWQATGDTKVVRWKMYT